VQYLWKRSFWTESFQTVREGLSITVFGRKFQTADTHSVTATVEVSVCKWLRQHWSSSIMDNQSTNRYQGNKPTNKRNDLMKKSQDKKDHMTTDIYPVKDTYRQTYTLKYKYCGTWGSHQKSGLPYPPDRIFRLSRHQCACVASRGK